MARIRRLRPAWLSSLLVFNVAAMLLCAAVWYMVAPLPLAMTIAAGNIVIIVIGHVIRTRRSVHDRREIEVITQMHDDPGGR